MFQSVDNVSNQFKDLFLSLAIDSQSFQKQIKPNKVILTWESYCFFYDSWSCYN